MVRPCKKRTICLELKNAYFRPEKFSGQEPAEIVLEVDEIEALRLADLDGEYQEAAARKMGISRATFSNIVKRARQKTAEAVIRGKALRLNCPRFSVKKEL